MYIYIYIYIQSRWNLNSERVVLGDCGDWLLNDCHLLQIPTNGILIQENDLLVELQIRSKATAATDEQIEKEKEEGATCCNSESSVFDK